MRVAWLMLAGLLLSAWPVAGQARLGEITANLSGTVAAGYTADYGNIAGSDHSWTVGGTANLTGSYHNPNFLSFTISPYLNQSRANSNFQSISDSSGINLSATIFGGSRFPGSVNFAKAFNSQGNYSVPGSANYVTHGDSDTFGINWSENIPNAPSFSIGYQQGNSQYDVYGSNDAGKNAFHTLNLHSSYTMECFNMAAFYTTGIAHSLIPQVVSGVQDSETQTDSNTYGFNITHRLPLEGSFSAGINRSDWNTEYQGTSTTGTVDLINALASMHPSSKLSLSASANYSDNLNGQLVESVAGAGGAVPGINSNQASNSLDLLGVANYSPESNLQTSAYVERRTQYFLGENYGVSSYGGSATYSHKVLDGNFNAAVNITANSANQNGEDTIGIATSEHYTSRIKGWNVTGSFGYAQNVQTLLVTYMNSSYNYAANASRRWGKFNMSAGGGAGRTALTQQAGTSNSSQSYNVSAGYGALITATGTYSKSTGQALATGAGLVPVPVPSPVLPSNMVSLYGGNGYSIGLSSSPARGLIISAAYGNSLSNTSTGGIASANLNNQFNSFVQYQFRKTNISSGFSRLGQGFSASGTQPEVISSFYIGVSRWFNFF